MRYLHIPSVIGLYIVLSTSSWAAEAPFKATLVKVGEGDQGVIVITSQRNNFTLTDVRINGGSCGSVAIPALPATLRLGELVKIMPLCEAHEMAVKSGAMSWIVTFN